MKENEFFFFIFRMVPELMTVKKNPNSINWTMENGYNIIDLNTTSIYPYRVFGSGPNHGLTTISMVYDSMMDYVCKGPIQGFKLHTPNEVAQVSKHNIRVPCEEIVAISIKPKLITTSDNLRKYTPNQRGCIFNTENRLKFFKIYTQRNCELECLANFTKIECGCVKFSMPSKKKFLSTKKVKDFQLNSSIFLYQDIKTHKFVVYLK